MISHPMESKFYGKVSFLKSGIRYSDRVTTVSPSYAREIIAEDYGCRLDGLLRQRMNRMTGILNGVDCDIWDPSNDRYLPATFGKRDCSGKAICKAELQRELGLNVDPRTPLVVWLSRITDQKMADLSVTRWLRCSSATFNSQCLAKVTLHSKPSL